MRQTTQEHSSLGVSVFHVMYKKNEIGHLVIWSFKWGEADGVFDQLDHSMSWVIGESSPKLVSILGASHRTESIRASFGRHFDAALYYNVENSTGTDVGKLESIRISPCGWKEFDPMEFHGISMKVLK